MQPLPARFAWRQMQPLKRYCLPASKLHLRQGYLRQSYPSTRNISRFPDRRPGASRSRPTIGPARPRNTSQRNDDRVNASVLEEGSSPANESPLWHESQRRAITDPADSLERLLSNDVLVVTRQIEMLNVFIGFEQSNKYAITNVHGEVLGYIAEESRGFFSVFFRQLFRTHRPFRALVMDAQGAPILWLRRPFAWINSRMYVQRTVGSDISSQEDPVLDTFAEVQQRWHLWRRRYDLFLRRISQPILSQADEEQPEPSPDEFHQFARVDSGFLAWTFPLHDGRGEEVARIARAFRGFGRELFTDTGQYMIQFTPEEVLDQDAERKPTVIRDLTLDEKAIVMALAVNVDVDYFSRHSEGGGAGLFWLGGGWGGSE